MILCSGVRPVFYIMDMPSGSDSNGENGRNKSRVCRNLFGNCPDEETDRFLKTELRKIQDEARDKWNFDFSRGKPLEGRYEWSVVGQEGEDHSRVSCETLRPDDEPPALTKPSSSPRQTSITEYCRSLKRSSSLPVNHSPNAAKRPRSSSDTTLPSTV